MFVVEDVAEFRVGSIDDFECGDDTNISTGSPETASTMAVPGPSSFSVGTGHKRSASNEEPERKRMNVQLYENAIDEEIEKKKIGTAYIRRYTY